MSKDDGGPAFPGVPDYKVDRLRADGDTPDPLYRILAEDAEPGMSLRDWFAGQALVAYAAGQLDAILDNECGDVRTAARRIIAQQAYMQADAMLGARCG